MNRPRKLRCDKLTELGPDDLEVVYGAAPKTLAQGCQIRSDLFQCVTYGYCPPPPAPES